MSYFPLNRSGKFQKQLFPETITLTNNIFSTQSLGSKIYHENLAYCHVEAYLRVTENSVSNHCSKGKIAMKCREGNGNPLQYSCLGNPMDGGDWQATVHGVVKSRTRLRDFTFTFHFHALEKVMATHSSILAWRIPGTGAWWAAVYGVTQSQTLMT